MEIHPSGLVPAEIENDPNVVQHSRISAHMGDVAPYALGIFRDIKVELRSFGRFGVLCLYYSRLVGGRRDEGKDTRNLIYFDEKLGLFVYCDIFVEKAAGKSRWARQIRLYAGPEGIAEKANKTLGRFVEPLAGSQQGSLNSLIVFDRSLRRFFHIGFDAVRWNGR